MKNLIKSSALITSGLLIMVATAGTFALWNDQESVSGGEVLSGNLDLNVTNASWEDVSLKDGSKGSVESLDKVTTSGPISDINNFRVSPGDTVIGTYNVNVALEGDNALAELLVNVENIPNLPNEFEIDYKINDGAWTDISIDNTVLFYSSDFAGEAPPESLLSNKISLPGDGSTDVIVDLRVYFNKDATSNMQNSFTLNSINFILSQVRATLPASVSDVNLDYDTNDSSITYNVNWEDQSDPSIIGYQVTIDEYSEIPSGSSSVGVINLNTNNLTQLINENDPAYLGTITEIVTKNDSSVSLSSTRINETQYARATVKAINKFGYSEKKETSFKKIERIPLPVTNLTGSANLDSSGNVYYTINWEDNNNSSTFYTVTVERYLSSGDLYNRTAHHTPIGIKELSIPRNSGSTIIANVKIIVTPNKGSVSGNPTIFNMTDGLFPIPQITFSLERQTGPLCLDLTSNCTTREKHPTDTVRYSIPIGSLPSGYTGQVRINNYTQAPDLSSTVTSGVFRGHFVSRWTIGTTNIPVTVSMDIYDPSGNYVSTSSKTQFFNR